MHRLLHVLKIVDYRWSSNKTRIDKDVPCNQIYGVTERGQLPCLRYANLVAIFSHSLASRRSGQATGRQEALVGQRGLSKWRLCKRLVELIPHRVSVEQHKRKRKDGRAHTAFSIVLYSTQLLMFRHLGAGPSGCRGWDNCCSLAGCDIAYDVSRLVRQRMCIAAGDRRRQGLPGVLCPALSNIDGPFCRIGAVYGCVTGGIANYPYRVILFVVPCLEGRQRA
ncbi:hypothetical protein EBH_0072990 [Eimeria brunetti]|uniref:Uncharacterized protein n=1 Tax=Eimeria brunetti TaxID=51314 RepID=U6LI45_9EIME|nr:hypothetical protein EBH_0072990 [Eimeria brunetti]